MSRRFISALLILMPGRHRSDDSGCAGSIDSYASPWPNALSGADYYRVVEQLTMDPRRTPKNVLNAHAPDQRSHTRIDLRPASHAACFPAPIAAETGSMPAHNSFRSDQRNSPEPRGKPTMQLDEEQAVAVPEVDATTHLASQSHTGTSEESSGRHGF